MLEGLEDMELKAYPDENLRIIPLFQIDVLKAVSEYVPMSALHEEE